MKPFSVDAHGVPGVLMSVPGAVPVHLNVLSSAPSEFLFNITFPEGSLNLNKLGFIHKRNKQRPPTRRFCLREPEEQKAELFETQPSQAVPFAAGRYKICFMVLAKTRPGSSERSPSELAAYEATYLQI